MTPVLTPRRREALRQKVMAEMNRRMPIVSKRFNDWRDWPGTWVFADVAVAALQEELALGVPGACAGWRISDPQHPRPYLRQRPCQHPGATMKEPQEIEALANRIDHEELWRVGLLERDSLTPEQRDRLDAGVYLRRYARDRFTVLEQLKEGREYMRGYKFTRYGMGTDARGCGDREWHAAINAFSNSEHYAWADKSRSRDFPWMMYLAKRVSDEVPRLILKFEQERRGMPDTYRHCSHDHRGTKLVDNHLKCALGKECRKCPYLNAIESSATMTPEAKDEAKAWTCATHILTERGENARYVEEFVYDKGDVEWHDRTMRTPNTKGGA